MGYQDLRPLSRRIRQFVHDGAPRDDARGDRPRGRHAVVIALLLIAAVATIPWAMTRSPLGALLHAAGLGASFMGAGGQETDTDGDTMPDAWETSSGWIREAPRMPPTIRTATACRTRRSTRSTGIPLGRHARYFAEGSTGYFDTSMGVLNLSDTADGARGARAPRRGRRRRSRISSRSTRGSGGPFDLDTIPGVAGAVSIIVESDLPIAADRTMTWGTSGVGMSLDSGSPGPATTWYFAEGATGPFLLYYLFENPGPTPANVTVRYLIEGAPPVTKLRTLAPHSRTTVSVNAEDPALANTSLGAVDHVERADPRRARDVSAVRRRVRRRCGLVGIERTVDGTGSSAKARPGRSSTPSCRW